jgi:hypothetical protein
MAGEYGEIDSRVGYYRMLGEAIDLVQSILTRKPDDQMMQLIFEELNAMRRWSADGRVPTDEERGSINVGLVAVRELPEATGEEGELVRKLFALNNYFEDWPTDQEAANAKDDGLVDAK